MRNRTATLAVVAAIVVLAVALGTAQTQNHNVQITKGPILENVTDSTAIIAWSTNVNSGTVVKYGTDPNNLNQAAQAPWGGLTHRVNIKNLQPNTTYYYDVESGQGQGTGTAAMSGPAHFTTKPLP